MTVDPQTGQAFIGGRVSIGGQATLCAVPTVLHVLPHEGGGGERYVTLLEGMGGFEHARRTLSAGRRPLTAAWSMPMRWRELARAASQHDLIHAHGDVTAALLTPLLARQPSVWTTHGLSFLRRARGPLASAARHKLRGAIAASDRTICCSHVEQEELGGIARPTLMEHLAVVHNGVPIAAPVEPLPRAQLGAEAGEALALFIGRLDEWKDPLTAVRAVRAARQRGAAITLAVAGDGPLMGAVRAHAGPGVAVLGFHENPARLLASADILVMPSRREALSYSVLDALARGVAIVSSDGLTLPEAVGEAGLIVPVGDVGAFADALARLAADTAERARLGSLGRQRHARLFSLERFRGEIAHVYEQALHTPPDGAAR